MYMCMQSLTTVQCHVSALNMHVSLTFMIHVEMCFKVLGVLICGLLVRKWTDVTILTYIAISSVIGSFANISSNLSWTVSIACSTSIKISGIRLSIVDRGSLCISDVFNINKAARFYFNLWVDSWVDIAEILLLSAASVTDIVT